MYHEKKNNLIRALQTAFQEVSNENYPLKELDKDYYQKLAEDFSHIIHAYVIKTPISYCHATLYLVEKQEIKEKCQLLCIFHELIHSTGHAKRLAREEVVTPNRFGSIPYSQEELVAELGASFLSHIAGIDGDPVFQNSASYIQGWLSKLKDDKQLIFKASAEAQTKSR